MSHMPYAINIICPIQQDLIHVIDTLEPRVYFKPHQRYTGSKITQIDLLFFFFSTNKHEP